MINIKCFINVYYISNINSFLKILMKFEFDKDMKNFFFF